MVYKLVVFEHMVYVVNGIDSHCNVCEGAYKEAYVFPL